MLSSGLVEGLAFSNPNRGGWGSPSRAISVQACACNFGSHPRSLRSSNEVWVLGGGEQRGPLTAAVHNQHTNKVLRDRYIKNIEYSEY